MIPKTFMPEGVDPSGTVLMPNHMGGSLENDHSYKAQAIADSLGMMVVAYERPGTGSSAPRTFILGVNQRFSSDNYAATAAQTGRVLEAAIPESMKDQPKVLFGDCAGAVDAVAVAMIAITRSETVGVDFLTIADPTAMKQMTKLGLGFRWPLQQIREARQKSPLSIEGAPSVSTKEMIVRAVPEVIAYHKLWRSVYAYSGLQDIAHKIEFGHIAVNVALMDQSFATTPKQAVTKTRVLNMSVAKERRAPFIAQVMPGRHSHFDDPANCTDFIRQTLNLQSGREVDS